MSVYPHVAPFDFPVPSARAGLVDADPSSQVRQLLDDFTTGEVEDADLNRPMLAVVLESFHAGDPTAPNATSVLFSRVPIITAHVFERDQALTYPGDPDIDGNDLKVLTAVISHRNVIFIPHDGDPNYYLPAPGERVMVTRSRNKSTGRYTKVRNSSSQNPTRTSTLGLGGPRCPDQTGDPEILFSNDDTPAPLAPEQAPEGGY